MSAQALKDQSFRDATPTIGKDGKREWVYPKKPQGKLYRWRTYLSLLLLTVLFTAPFISIDGHPLILLNIFERKFILFGIAFWPQDFFLFVFAMITFIMFIILFTVIFGRIWCGWACPQTIFLEMVFRRIEYWIDGDSNQQKALARSPWNTDKIIKRFTKYSVFILVSLLIVNTFAAYIISINTLKDFYINPGNHIVGHLAIFIISGLFFGVYTRFREQVCLVVCPYGRLQGVLLDKNTLMVSYDKVRGEPRGKIHKNKERSIGDCVDCLQCLQVCPGGIDIRNGSQLECINCTACIDACNSMMERLNMPKGLIRYDSEYGIVNKTKFRFTARIIAYTVVLIVLFGVFTTLLAIRSDVQATVLRTSGMMYQTLPDNKVSNLYTYQIINKTFKNLPVQLRLVEPAEGEIKWVGKESISVSQDSLAEGEFFIILPQSEIKYTKTPLKIDLYSNGKFMSHIKTSFLGPNINANNKTNDKN